MLGVVMRPGFNGLELGKSLMAEEDADLHRSLPARRYLLQGH